MKYTKAVLAVVLLASAAGALAAPAQLRVYTEASLPTSMKEGGQIIGSGTEKVREIMVRTGTSYTLDLLPWRRAYTFTEQYENACLFSTTRTPEREHLFQWVGPTEYADWVLLGRADRDYKLATLEDARQLRIGTYNGDARDQYLRARGFQVDSAPHDMINPGKLMLNRIDLWAASLKRGSAVIVRNGWKAKIVPVLTFNRVELYLACNRAVPAALIDKMNAAMESMVRDGTVKRIDDKYEKWPRGGAGVQ